MPKAGPVHACDCESVDVAYASSPRGPRILLIPKLAIEGLDLPAMALNRAAVLALMKALTEGLAELDHGELPN